MRAVLQEIGAGLVRALGAGMSGWVSLDRSDNPLAGVGRRSHSGASVTADATMQLSAAWSCIRNTAQVCAALPGALYIRGADGAKTRVEADLHQILTMTPNQNQTGFEFWEGMITQMLLKGNACAERLRVGDRLVGLEPIPALRPYRHRDGGIRYELIDRGKREYLPPEKVFHLRGFGAGDGIGMSAVRYGVHTFGAALSADEAAGKVFANGLFPSGVFKTEKTLTSEQRDKLQALADDYSGSRRVGKTLALEAGVDFQQTSMNPEDAQLLETRKFQIEEICRWFGVPPIIIGHASEGQTMWGSGVEQIMLSWLTLGINPLLNRIERRIIRDLIPAARRAWFFEFNREAMLQMDSRAKGDFLTKMRFAGIMTGNEGRDKLNLPRHPDADDLLVQTSLTPADILGRDSA